mgnify:FL=1|jgi:5-methylcytosine-specific restriction endonuclease McrA
MLNTGVVEYRKIPPPQNNRRGLKNLPPNHKKRKSLKMNLPRPDRNGPHRVAFEKNKNIILKTRNTCGICGLPVDKSLKYPHPLSPVIDHIIPINRNGHPSDINNLQLAHWQCNRQKSDKLYADSRVESSKVVGNRNLPQSRDWTKYRA